MKHMKNAFKILSPFLRTILEVYKMILGPQFLGREPLLMSLINALCDKGTLGVLDKYIHLPELPLQIPNQAYCDLVLPILGVSPSLFDREMLVTYLSYQPAGTSTKTMAHYSQLAIDKDGEFRKFDYGRKENQKKYGKDIPPAYNLSKVTATTAIIAGWYDAIATVDDSMTLVKSWPT